MDDLSEYRYTRLPTPDHIRLLELLRCNRVDNDVLHCRLFPAILPEVADTYTAVSYT
jgi:hypothetical protein